jgi:HAD superfamily hydrolase (TIGR01549 family)
LIEAVVFDLDGTLVHLPIDYESLFREFKRIMRVENVHPVLEVVSKVDAATRGQVFEVWEKAELEASTRMTINREGMKLYEKFAQKPKALVTMQGRTLANNVLGKLGLVFDVILTREDSLDRAEQLRIAAETLKTETAKVLFVGNTKNDATAARKTGCKFKRLD